MQRIWIGLGALAGFGAVAMAAFAAHGVSDAASARIVGSGVQMEGWHALALLASGFGRRAAGGWRMRRGWRSLSAWCCSAGRSTRWAWPACLGAARAHRRHAADDRLAAAGGVSVARAMIGSAYLAAEGFEAPLAEELTRRGVTISAWHGRLALSPDPPVRAAWALDIWTDPREIEVASVKTAADALREIQRNWAAYGAGHHRRMALIGERLPPVKARVAVPGGRPGVASGGWTLLGPDRLLASPAKSSPFVNGECHFVEDRAGPPSRAYLKLWEALVRFGRWPKAGERCLDLGASPGGWTWVLATLGADVTAVDKAPLVAAVAAMPGSPSGWTVRSA